MERLTFRNGDGIGWPHELSIWKLAAKLCDYEDAEEQGRLIEFPVAIGDTVYEIIPTENNTVDKVTVTQLAVWNNGSLVASVASGHGEKYERSFCMANIGYSIFHTRDEAEARLKEMEVDSHGDS